MSSKTLPPSSILNDYLKHDYLKLADIGILSKSSIAAYGGVTATDIPTYEIGFFSQDEEEFYVLFDSVNGDMEFSSAEGLGKYINSKEFKVGSFEWVTDNDPIELDCIQWYETDAGKIIGNHVIIPAAPSPFTQKFDYSNILELLNSPNP